MTVDEVLGAVDQQIAERCDSDRRAIETALVLHNDDVDHVDEQLAVLQTAQELGRDAASRHLRDWLHAMGTVDLELITTAFHEAAHGCVAISVGVEVAYINTHLNRGYRGVCVTNERHSAIRIDRLLLFTLSGVAAEGRIWSRDLLQRAAIDLNVADAILSACRLERQLGIPTIAGDLSLDAWQRRAAAVVDAEWGWIERVALLLTQLRQLTGYEIRALRDA